MRHGQFRALGLLVFAILRSGVLAAQAPTLSGCPAFPADNIWNVPVDTLPVDRNSAAYVATVGPDRTLFADFGSGTFNGGPIGIPYTTVPANQPKVGITFQYADESDPGPYPIPPDAPIEGGSASTGDRHILIVDRDNCLLYEIFAAYAQAGGSWRAGSGAVFNLRSQALRPETWTSADAAGLPILPGLVRYDEVAAGEIRHAVRFTVPRTQRKYLWPARHFASNLTGAEYPPMGVRFRLRANYDLSGFSPEVQVILRALKKYGMMLADNGSAWFISGVPDPRWNNDRLREIRRVRGSDLEAVDVSSLMIAANSGQARVAPRPAGSVLNGASFLPGPVAPGEIVSIFGAGMGPAVGVGARLNAAGLLDTMLDETRVLFDGLAAPLIYAQAGQVNAIVPYPVAGQATTGLQVEYRGVRSETLGLTVAESAPAIFTANSSGAGPGAIFHPDWSLNSATNPADRGGIVVLFATGEGQTDPAGTDGKLAAEVWPRPRLPVSLRIGGLAATLLYAGAAPGQVAGLMQVNARIPEEVASGSIPIVLSVGSNASRPDVTLAVR